MFAQCIALFLKMFGMQQGSGKPHLVFGYK